MALYMTMCVPGSVFPGGLSVRVHCPVVLV